MAKIKTKATSPYVCVYVFFCLYTYIYVQLCMHVCAQTLWRPEWCSSCTTYLGLSNTVCHWLRILQRRWCGWSFHPIYYQEHRYRVVGVSPNSYMLLFYLKVMTQIDFELKVCKAKIDMWIKEITVSQLKTKWMEKKEFSCSRVTPFMVFIHSIKCHFSQG